MSGVQLEYNWFLSAKAENTALFYNSEALDIVVIAWNTSD
jgi:hypothetical protein